MALLFADGFDHYGTTAAMKQANWAGTCALYINAISRTGTACLSSTGAAAFNFAALQEGIIGCGVYQADLGNGDVRLQLFNGNFAGPQITLVPQANGSMRVYLGDIPDSGGVLIGATDANTFKYGAWQYMEMGWKTTAAGGYFKLRFNGVQALAVANVAYPVDTSIVQFGMSNYSGSAEYWDDVVLLNKLGASNNDFIGDIRCRTIFPDGDTATAAWVPKTAGAQYSEINRVPADTANHYISAANIGDASKFTAQDVPVNTAFAFGVVAHLLANKSDAGTCSIEPSVFVGASQSVGAAIVPGTGVAVYSRVFETDPSTGGAWTKASLNNIQPQVKRTA